MAIKEDINYIKNEISSQEQFLENAIRSERFLKKNKKIIIAIVVIALFTIFVYVIKTIAYEKNLETTNQAYKALLQNPNDSAAQSILKEKSPSLFALYAIKNANDTNSTALIDEALNMQIDPLLKEVINSAKNQNTDGLMSSYAALISGYELLKQNKIEEAKIEFSKIPQNSPLEGISKNLQHYQGK
ncbi:hypothetical protein CIG11343_1146 [Campylobacter iguaniorum]|uniref:hypothetical protein n=1 Tax=Campylobacter iguaniorum TaxID=1244531 RepID=UPI0007C96D04|nr:hypothetical protein [Campylobacter iguaniorum]ANE36160.1 hypothetical protein CIG11343_1146 [Campylobacter iguaniorum]